jgi:hypothetical protein
MGHVGEGLVTPKSAKYAAVKESIEASLNKTRMSVIGDERCTIRRKSLGSVVVNGVGERLGEGGGSPNSGGVNGGVNGVNAGGNVDASGSNAFGSLNTRASRVHFFDNQGGQQDQLQLLQGGSGGNHSGGGAGGENRKRRKSHRDHGRRRRRRGDTRRDCDSRKRRRGREHRREQRRDNNASSGHYDSGMSNKDNNASPTQGHRMASALLHNRKT